MFLVDFQNLVCLRKHENIQVCFFHMISSSLHQTVWEILQAEWYNGEVPIYVPPLDQSDSLDPALNKKAQRTFIFHFLEFAKKIQ